MRISKAVNSLTYFNNKVLREMYILKHLFIQNFLVIEEWFRVSIMPKYLICSLITRTRLNILNIDLNILNIFGKFLKNYFLKKWQSFL